MLVLYSFTHYISEACVVFTELLCHSFNMCYNVLYIIYYVYMLLINDKIYKFYLLIEGLFVRETYKC